jgi:hypothetical protein
MNPFVVVHLIAAIGGSVLFFIGVLALIASVETVAFEEETHQALWQGRAEAMLADEIEAGRISLINVELPTTGAEELFQLGASSASEGRLDAALTLRTLALSLAQ